MSDRELLELAAKAVGYTTNHPMNAERMELTPPVCALWVVRPDGKFSTGWDPLANDGDALRLASALRLLVKPGKHKGDGCTVESQRDGIAGCTSFRDDPAAQMREAIVRAAAEIGKAIP